ncbi:zf-C3HC4_3 domain-containing protein [Cephalotus follicularis]|uniref:Zf-C3HC4_3 domain-containing protein n=1 Tax=Cephalotus follicularis TaxID=3775 RepID=A0A1Q3AZR0_CEPFO|nr:zf-C3HC4_3 domain-containing protein [Cephalotus follicularis]
MEGLDVRRATRRTLKQRLGLKAMGCCGATWGFRPTSIGVRDNDEEGNQDQDQDQQQRHQHQQQIVVINMDPGCPDPDPISPGMNLAAALAAERHLRASHEAEGTAARTPLRVSLMKLLQETDGGDGMENGGFLGSDQVCCVCMVRKKGAAFISCGHTFCRVCSREMWLNRGSCPLCNHRSSIAVVVHRDCVTFCC